MRFIFSGSLAGAWSDFGGLTAQLTNLAHVIEMAITDHPGIVITYDYRVRQLVRNLAHRRAVNTDYFDLLSNVRTDVRNAVLRGFETQAEVSRKAKGKLKTAKEKEAKNRSGKGTDKAGRENAKAAPRGKQWAESDCSDWKKKRNSGATTKEAGEAEKTGENKGGRWQKEVISMSPR